MSEFGDNNRRKFKSHSIRSDCHDLSPRDVRVKRSLLCRELCCLYNGEPPRVELQCIVGRRMTVYIKNKLKKNDFKRRKTQKKKNVQNRRLLLCRGRDDDCDGPGGAAGHIHDQVRQRERGQCAQQRPFGQQLLQVSHADGQVYTGRRRNQE